MTAKPRMMCPNCGVGPFTIRAAYDNHVAGCVPEPAPEPEPQPVPAPAAAVVKCPDCPRTFKPSGLAIHYSRVHGPKDIQPAERTQAATGRPTPALLVAELDRLLPGSPLVDLLAEFVAKNQPDPALWVVATGIPGRGPWLCRTSALGLLADREHVPIVAVRVADIIEYQAAAA